MSLSVGTSASDSILQGFSRCMREFRRVPLSFCSYIQPHLDKERKREKKEKKKSILCSCVSCLIPPASPETNRHRVKLLQTISEPSLVPRRRALAENPSDGSRLCRGPGCDMAQIHQPSPQIRTRSAASTARVPGLSSLWLHDPAAYLTTM